MDIKLVVVDLDGTLVMDDNTVTKRTAEVFRRARSRGIRIAVATGRALEEGVAAADAVGADEYIIALAGCQIYDRKRQRNLLLNRLTLVQAMELAEILKRHPGTFYQLYSGRKIITTSEAFECIYHCPLPEGYPEYAKSIMTIVPDMAEYLRQRGRSGEKYFLCSNESGSIRSLRRAFADVPGIFVVQPCKGALEVTPEGADKGAALRMLRKHMGIEKKQIMVIGDSENDMALFAEGGFRVAMGNAFDCLKERADYIAPPYDRDGAAYAVEKYLLG